ncbi:MAG: CocE/NonD family hydrolase [Chloroflexi bacterium]|nr:CocE/NonD family hydrolase [Chloroflexota bacterium]
MTSSGGSAADSAGYDVRERYTKYEYRIPMRDGVRLFTSVLVPKDTSTTYPILLTRTPFGVSPYGVDEQGAFSLQSEALLRAGYIFVRQDVRGRLMSEGTFTHVTPHRPEKPTPTDVDEQSDTWDTVEWLLRHVPNHNGRVGLFGISYGGFFTAAGMIGTHPAIRAASPQAPVADLFLDDDWYHGGAFMLAHAFNSVSVYQPQSEPTPPAKVTVPFDYGTEDGYEFYLRAGPIANLAAKLGTGNPTWDELLAHPTYDEFWQSRAIWRHLKDVRCPVLTVAGWFDAEDLMGPFRVTARSRARTRVSLSASSLGRGCTAAGRTRTATTSGASTSPRTPQRSTASTSCCRSSTSTSRTGVTRSCQRPTCSRRARTPGGNIQRGRHQRRSHGSSISAKLAGCRSSRRTKQTPAIPTSAIRRNQCHGLATRPRRCPRSTWSPTSGSPRRGRTCWSTRRSCSRRTSRWPGRSRRSWSLRLRGPIPTGS